MELHVAEERQALGDGQAGDLDDAFVAQVHGAAVGLKTAAFARRARNLAQEVPVPLAGTRVLVEGRQDTSVAEVEVAHGQLLLGRAVKQGAPGLGRERGIRRVQAKAQGIPRDREQSIKRRVLHLPPSADGPVAHAEMRHYDPLAIDAFPQPQPLANLAHTLLVIEGEALRRQGREGPAALRAGIAAAEAFLGVIVGRGHDQLAASQL